MMKRKIVLFIFLISSLYGFSHKYYVSISTMDYNEENKTIEASIKLIAHDLEHILENKFDKRIEMENISDSSKIGLYIQSYLKENFIITSVKEQCEMTYIGKEVTVRDDLFFYVSFKNIANPMRLFIKNTILFDFFPAQQNIVHYNYKGVKKSVTLIGARPEGSIEI